MDQKTRTPFLCALGFHKWISISATTAPWWAISNPDEIVFRGCLRCREEQVIQLLPTCLPQRGVGAAMQYAVGWEPISLYDLLKIYYTQDEIVHFNRSVIGLAPDQVNVRMARFYLDGLIRKA